tara:strand:- start:922 stop:1227 length:306 start_codon:yes stop_codon:yes gene_type:complete
MNGNKHKIYLGKDKYVYKYQFRFLKNIIKTDKHFGSTELQDLMDKFIVYNIISDIHEKDTDAASLVWFEEEESVAYQFPSDGTVVSSLSGIGYEMPEDEWS